MDVSQEVGPSDRVAIYRVPDGELATGSTLGGPKVCLTLKATGAIEKIFGIDQGEDLFGSLVLNYWDARNGARLTPQDGTFIIHPEHQEYAFRLDNGIQVTEDVFVLSSYPAGGDQVDPPAVYYTVRLHNGGRDAISLATYAYCQLGGPTPQASAERALAVTYHADLHALVGQDRARATPARAFGCSLPPTSYETTVDEGKAEAERCPGALAGTTAAGGTNPLGVFHHHHELAPAAEITYAYLLTFGGQGESEAVAAYRACPNAEDALRVTKAHYSGVLRQAVVITPNAQVNHGALWAKVNMLRVQTRTPTGWTFTNNPTHSNKAVGRDTAWSALGFDYLSPRFTRETLLAFVRRQEPRGMIVEDYDFRTGETADDGLNINDNTPLLVLALWHHYCATGDRPFLEEVYPAAVKAARYIVSQENEQGLVWCTATATGGKGIIGWRNVLTGYRLSGATTEVNSECFAALLVAAQMAGVLGKGDEHDEFLAQAEALKVAVNRHLVNPENGLYYRNIDVDGSLHSDVTSDLIFPLMFGLASDDAAVRIVQRLSAPDFWTDAGIRTAPRTAPSYSAEHGNGLLGGVWVGVTTWFAYAAARYVPSLVGQVLDTSFQHYSRSPRQNNTVPGQFSEWLQGESLANQGMMLSPWFPPRYLWSIVEGLAGLTPAAGGVRLQPHLPPEWAWLGVRDLLFRDRALTWLTVRGPDMQTFTNFEVEGAAPTRVYHEALGDAVKVRGDHGCALGLRTHDELLLFAGNTVDQSLQTVLQVEAPLTGRYRVRRMDSVRRSWDDGDSVAAEQLAAGLPLRLEPRGFCLLEAKPERA